MSGRIKARICFISDEISDSDPPGETGSEEAEATLQEQWLPRKLQLWPRPPEPKLRTAWRGVRL